jgi:hypothetical protein
MLLKGYPPEKRVNTEPPILAGPARPPIDDWHAPLPNLYLMLAEEQGCIEVEHGKIRRSIP